MNASRRPRATPLSADDRRASLIAAVIPLVGTHGRDVTTRQIADAAGVAEGTIFRVFPDKDALIDAAIDHVLDASDVVDALENLDGDASASVDERVRVIVELIRNRLESVYHVLFAVRHGAPSSTGGAGRPRRPRPEQNERIDRAVAAALSGQLGNADPLEAARWIRLSTMAATHPMMTNGRPLDTDRIVAYVLTGVTGAAKTQPC